MCDMFSVINQGFWSEMCIKHTVTLWGQLCLLAEMEMSELVICLPSPLSVLLVKRVISARAHEGCRSMRVHVGVWFQPVFLLWDKYNNLASRGLLLLLCRDTWQHMTEQLEYWMSSQRQSYFPLFTNALFFNTANIASHYNFWIHHYCNQLGTCIGVHKCKNWICSIAR